MDAVLDDMIAREELRQREGIELIASENYVSQAVLRAQGSVLTNKYAEGFAGKRYYGGCSVIDEVEICAIDRLKELYGCEDAVVQPHSGSQANMAALMSVMEPGDTLLGMELSQGGHLTHGSPVNFSGKLYRAVFYGTDLKTGLIDWASLEKKAMLEKPRVIIAGASAYPRTIDFARFRRIADACGAILLADIAHIAGLIAAHLHPSPIGVADIITSTTHKTLRGPRGGIVMGSKERMNAVRRALFPGIQGGPLMHVIAAKAVSFGEALQPSFAIYQAQIIKNAHVLATRLQEHGFSLITGGTDNHMIVIDVTSKNIDGKTASELLEQSGITVNKNAIPGDTRNVTLTSGIRIGTPAVTTRGMKEQEMLFIADAIHEALEKNIHSKVRAFASNYPLFAGDDHV